MLCILFHNQSISSNMNPLNKFLHWQFILYITRLRLTINSLSWLIQQSRKGILESYDSALDKFFKKVLDGAEAKAQAPSGG